MVLEAVSAVAVVEAAPEPEPAPALAVEGRVTVLVQPEDGGLPRMLLFGGVGLAAAAAAAVTLLCWWRESNTFHLIVTAFPCTPASAPSHCHHLSLHSR